MGQEGMRQRRREALPAQKDLSLDELAAFDQDARESADGAIVRRVDLRAGGHVAESVS